MLLPRSAPSSSAWEEGSWCWCCWDRSWVDPENPAALTWDILSRGGVSTRWTTSLMTRWKSFSMRDSMVLEAAMRTPSVIGGRNHMEKWTDTLTQKFTCWTTRILPPSILQPETESRLRKDPCLGVIPTESWWDPVTDDPDWNCPFHQIPLRPGQDPLSPPPSLSPSLPPSLPPSRTITSKAQQDRWYRWWWGRRGRSRDPLDGSVGSGRRRCWWLDAWRRGSVPVATGAGSPVAAILGRNSRSLLPPPILINQSINQSMFIGFPWRCGH